MAFLGGGSQLGGGAPVPQSPTAAQLPTYTPNDPLGVDISCGTDLDPFGAYVSGKTALAQALLRRLTTARGSLFYDKSYGTDLRLYLNEAMTADGQSRVRAAVEAECRKDERVSACTASVTFSLQTQTLKVSISVTAGSGPFSLTLAVSQLTVDLLAVS